MAALNWSHFLSLVVIVAYTVARLFEIKQKRETVSGRIVETLTLRLFIVFGLITTAIGIVEMYMRDRPFDPVLFFAGCLAYFVSFLIRRAAIRHLGRWWSTHVEIREGHTLVCTGPFRFVRHPTYLSQIIELLAPCLITHSVWALLFGAITFVPTVTARIKIEERALVEKLGSEYLNYRSRVPCSFLTLEHCCLSLPDVPALSIY